jgi:hypothetical protein
VDWRQRHGHGRKHRRHRLPAPGFVKSLAHRITKFQSAGLVAVKDRVKAIALAAVEDFRRDSDLFGEGSRNPEPQSPFQTRHAELDLARLLGELTNH